MKKIILMLLLSFTLNAMEINLPDRKVEVVTERVERGTIIGRIEGIDSEVFMTRGVGSVRINNVIYKIENGKASVVKEPKVYDKELKGKNFPKSVFAVQEGTVIDVMVAYTPRVTNGIAKAENAIAMANQSYINSNIDLRLNLVHTTEVAYTETGNMITTIEHLTSKTDGYMDEIHALRDKYFADIVVLLSVDTNYCGIGWIMQTPSIGFERNAFSVVKDSCIPTSTLTHEIGHNLGSMHDIASSSYPGAFEYSYGYRICGDFRTIMSYACSGAVRITQISNPNIFHEGKATGTALANNALSITNTKDIASQWRVNTNTIPVSPSNLLAKTLSDSEISISWSDNSSNESGYLIERDGIEIASIGANITEYVDTGLTQLTLYQYRARAYNSTGTSAYSNTSSASTLELTCSTNDPSMYITPSKVYAQYGEELEFSTLVNNNDTCGTTTFSTSSGSYTIEAGKFATILTNEVIGFVEGITKHTVTISSYNHDDVSVSSEIIVDTTDPTKVTLVGERKRGSQVFLSWNASTDETSGIKDYSIVDNTIVIGSTTQLNYVLKSVSGAHNYIIIANDYAGNTSVSNAVSISIQKKGKGKPKK